MKNQARYQIMKMIFSLKGNYLLYQLGLNGFPAKIIRLLIGLLWSFQGQLTPQDLAKRV